MKNRNLFTYLPGPGPILGILLQTSPPAPSEGRLERGLGAISATEELSKEHALLFRLLIAMENLADKAARDPNIDLTPIRKAAVIIKGVVADHHMTFEEEHIYPKFERTPQAGQLRDLARTLRDQHDKARRVNSRIIDLASSNRRSVDQINELRRLIYDETEMFRAHVAWEESVLFTAMYAALTRDTIRDINTRMIEEERRFFGRNGLEKFFHDLAEIERSAGTHDLSRFPFR